MKTIKIIVSMVVVILGSQYAQVVQAQSASLAPWQERAAERQDAREERVEERVERRCEMVNSRIERRISFYEEHYAQVEARMERVTSRLDELTDRLEAKGYDVSQVRGDLTTLETMRGTRRNLYTAFIDELQETKQYDCGDSEGAFRSTLEQSREALAKWREQIKANHDFIQDTLRPDLQALREQEISTTN